ncbi:hypothetical protein GCM10011389_05280 [Pontibacillus salipaludis]|uniref:Uncharacterized protein n=1 Tax=Pontibacillus salipaludis TaxID=1697394 RepID=A0ABQ1PQ39_9BACI|nr:hypothetical protein GCM10011389_05280 [Pontibacillus salipaludis]
MGRGQKIARMLYELEIIVYNRTNIVGNRKGRMLWRIKTKNYTKKKYLKTLFIGMYTFEIASFGT